MARLRHAHKKAGLGATQVEPEMHHCHTRIISEDNGEGHAKTKLAGEKILVSFPPVRLMCH
jgi:hypothetical protein